MCDNMQNVYKYLSFQARTDSFCVPSDKIRFYGVE